MFEVALFFQIAAAQPSAPVLSFPEPGLDDSAAYAGYRTRFFQDASRNTVQIYIDSRSGRVVHLWADADDESLGFTARDAAGRPADLDWGTSGARTVEGPTRWRQLEYGLRTENPLIQLGHWVLGSMRVERDFQYAGKQMQPLDAPPFALPELTRMFGALDRLDPAERRRHLAVLHASTVAQVRARTRPTLRTLTRGDTSVVRIVEPSLDGADSLAIEVRARRSQIAVSTRGGIVTLRSRSGRAISFGVRIATTAKPLTALRRTEIFTPEFLAFLAAAAPGGVAGRWLEREVRGVELLSSREKLMAGLPAYATYFGRDMLVSALMMRPIWRDEMSEFAIASALRKLSPRGDVSHEEALGGQADREAASEYAALVDQYLEARGRGNAAAAAQQLAHARDVLRNHRRVRENYHMIDDEFQFVVLTGRWLSDPKVSAEHKRAFLLDSSDGKFLLDSSNGSGGSRAARLVRELALVSSMTYAYALQPDPTHLVSFMRRDNDGWGSASWRDSGAGYAGGRFSMDVNAIWAPRALEAMTKILATLRAIGISPDSLADRIPGYAVQEPFRTYARDSMALNRAIDAWRGAWRHFVVALGPAEIHSRVDARLAALPDSQRTYWTTLVSSTHADADSLAFLALSLDTDGHPVGVANTDPATGLFLGDDERGTSLPDSATMDRVLRDVRLFVRPYPVGLFIDRVGPVVANDAYATPSVWRDFERDLYHSPRVVWGREVNLFLLGAMNRIAAAQGASMTGGASTSYTGALRDAIARVRSAVESSGFRSELWSYEFRDGRPLPVRYGSGSDVQLWSTTDLVVQYGLYKLGLR